jgi:hypothetical protein
MGKRRLFRFMVIAPLSGFRVCRKIGLIFVAGVTVAAGAELAARVLPSLAFPVPMETKLRQGGGNLWRLPVVKLNPNPLAHYLCQFPKARRFMVEQVQEFLCGKCPILKSESEINPMRLVFNALCGPVQEPRIRI